MSLYDAFWTHVDKSDGCWEWTGNKSPDGYGRAGTHKSHGTSLPHRAVWIEAHGPIADGLTLDHLCNNRLCVRLDHLEPVTHLENVQRAAERRTQCRNGHPIEMQVSDYKGGRRCVICRRAANAASAKRWRRANRERVNAYARAYRARQRAAAIEEVAA